jgi:hypothetical protein
LSFDGSRQTVMIFPGKRSGACLGASRPHARGPCYSLRCVASRNTWATESGWTGERGLNYERLLQSGDTNTTGLIEDTQNAAHEDFLAFESRVDSEALIV